ncbi:MAG: hypothetical protein NC935_08380 [Candidatus Omnitrophica bacterium]|nr:hypothetical protein [Candidatus Omnitrophota bacterium]
MGQYIDKFKKKFKVKDFKEKNKYEKMINFIKNMEAEINKLNFSITELNSRLISVRDYYESLIKKNNEMYEDTTQYLTSLVEKVWHI